MGIGALGAGVLGALGATGAWAAAGGIVAGIVGGAIVGAAVGGLTSAIMGGDILEGMLFGAIGGAVTGGISAWAAGGTLAGPATSTATDVASQSLIASEGVGWGPTVNAANASGQSTSSILSGLGESTKDIAANSGGSVISDFIKEGIGGWMDSEAANSAGEEAARQAELQRQHELTLQANAPGHPGFDPARMAELNQRKTEFAEDTRRYKEGREDILQAGEKRGAALSGSLDEPYDPLAGMRDNDTQGDIEGAAPVEEVDKIQGVK